MTYINSKNITVKRGKRYICIAFILAVLLLSGCNESSIEYTEYEATEGVEAVEEEETEYKENTTEISESKHCYVHICGNISKPGVYEAKSDERVVDIVVKAGGFTPEADENAVNLASYVEDGQKIYIPSTEENYIEGKELVDDGKININTAEESQLTTISGIGPSRAKSIIEYRESNGAFKRIEDIKKVSGIGDASFNKMKEQISVN